MKVTWDASSHYQASLKVDQEKAMKSHTCVTFNPLWCEFQQMDIITHLEEFFNQLDKQDKNHKNDLAQSFEPMDELMS